MRQLPYASSAAPLRFLFPEEWDPKLVTAVSLTVNDRDADELIAAANATLYTATTLDVDADRFAQQLTLVAGAGNLDIDDPILIEGVAGDEIRRVEGFDDTNKIARLERILDKDHEAGDTVRGLFGDISVNLSTVTTFTKGLVVTLVWTPTGHGLPITEQAQIAASALDLMGLRQEFKDVYPRAYDAFTLDVDKLDGIAAIAERRVARDLRAENLDIQRVVDQDEIRDAVMAQMTIIWLLNGDDDKEYELKVLSGEYGRQLASIMALPIWTDDDQDGIEDEEEFSDHDHIFLKGW